MVSIVATPDPTTGSMLVQTEQTIGRDLFTRVVAGGWGNMTTGQAWQNNGGAAGDFSVNGVEGQVSNNSLNASRLTTFDTLSTDHDFTIHWRTAVVLPTGNNFIGGAVARYTDTNNYYLAAVDLAPNDVVTLTIRKRVLGVNSNVTSSFTLPFLNSAGVIIGIRIAVCGHQIKAKAWNLLQSEPDWILTASDFDLTTGTRTGQRSLLSTGVTNVLPVPWQFDNAVAIIGQPFRVFRSVGGVETELRGSPGNSNKETAAADSATATYWDNEGPFNVSTTYVLKSNCNDTNIATSTPVTLDSDFGWLRDPTNPSRNIELIQDDLFDPCVDEQVVVFSGLGNPAYVNSSGIFPIIDAERPRVVSQTRKNYASALTLTSFSLDDILDLEDLYRPGAILSLSLPTSFGWALRTSGTDYIVIGDVSQAYLGVDQELTARVWSMPFWLTGPPADTSEGGTGGSGIGGGDAIYDVLAASVLGTTYNTLTASGQTYDQVAAGTGY
jgi:hypothetical protein